MTNQSLIAGIFNGISTSQPLKDIFGHKNNTKPKQNTLLLSLCILFIPDGMIFE